MIGKLRLRKALQDRRSGWPRPRPPADATARTSACFASCRNPRNAARACASRIGPGRGNPVFRCRSSASAISGKPARQNLSRENLIGPRDRVAQDGEAAKSRDCAASTAATPSARTRPAAPCPAAQPAIPAPDRRPPLIGRYSSGAPAAAWTCGIAGPGAARNLACAKGRTGRSAPAPLPSPRDWSTLSATSPGFCFFSAPSGASSRPSTPRNAASPFSTARSPISS